MVKYRYSRIRQNKAVLSCFNSRVYKYTTHAHKTQYKQNLSHCRRHRKQNRQTERKTKPKTPPTMPQKRHTTHENKNGIQEHTPTKRKRPTEQNTLRGKKKSRPRKSRTA